mmetsp:Transcript_3407/g.13174  ORF Transcript_3407/g.13174 Transcript_3407/m.13174 type:complete len:213 (+) Transcript_3407:460-1098(+)
MASKCAAQSVQPKNSTTQPRMARRTCGAAWRSELASNVWKRSHSELGYRVAPSAPAGHAGATAAQSSVGSSTPWRRRIAPNAALENDGRDASTSASSTALARARHRARGRAYERACSQSAIAWSRSPSRRSDRSNTASCSPNRHARSTPSRYARGVLLRRLPPSLATVSTRWSPALSLKARISAASASSEGHAIVSLTRPAAWTSRNQSKIS